MVGSRESTYTFHFSEYMSTTFHSNLLSNKYTNRYCEFIHICGLRKIWIFRNPCYSQYIYTCIYHGDIYSLNPYFHGLILSIKIGRPRPTMNTGIRINISITTCFRILLINLNVYIIYMCIIIMCNIELINKICLY